MRREFKKDLSKLLIHSTRLAGSHGSIKYIEQLVSPLGQGVVIGIGSVIGGDPQDLKYQGEETWVEIGDRTVVREYSTVNRGTPASHLTRIGRGSFIMSYVHLAHDCDVGDGVIIANGTQLAGHVTVHDRAILSGLVAVHQFVTIGVVFDRHTAEGKRVLRDVARDLHMPLPLLEWSLFYYEGAVANADAPSPWWQAYCRWHFERLGMPPAEAHLLWKPAREQIIDALAEDSRRLQSDLYRWKLGNLERIDSLKRQVELFASHIKEVQHDQSTLF